MADQSRFAKAGRGGDQGQLAGQTLVEAVNQAQARDKTGPQSGRRVGAGNRDIKFGL